MVYFVTWQGNWGTVCVGVYWQAMNLDRKPLATTSCCTEHIAKQSISTVSGTRIVKLRTCCAVWRSVTVCAGGRQCFFFKKNLRSNSFWLDRFVSARHADRLINVTAH